MKSKLLTHIAAPQETSPPERPEVFRQWDDATGEVEYIMVAEDANAYIDYLLQQIEILKASR